MWQVTGKTIDPGLFEPFEEPFEAVEVLYDFDGPRTFSHHDRNAQLCLAHWCDADNDYNRFIVVPITDVLIQVLKIGAITLRDAIDQPRLWILDIAHCGKVHEAWKVSLANIPADVLPKPGTMLWASLERSITVKPLTKSLHDTTPDEEKKVG